MRPVSQEFLDLIATSHRVATVARIYTAGGDWADLQITDGQVSLDALAATRGRCDITLEGIDWVPRSVTDKLAPHGNEINLGRGVYLPDGSTEIVSLGWFGLEDADVSDEGNLTTRVSALDRSNRIGNAKFEDMFTLPAGSPVCEAILALAQAAWPDVPYDPQLPNMSAVALTAQQPLVAFPGDDRWEVMQGLAKAIGMILYFDGDGLLTLRRYANAGAVATVSEGPGGVLLSVGRNWSRTEAFNRVIATGENTNSGAVYRAVATDDNPMSPTYYFGDFGRVPRFYDSPYIQSDAQAQDAANAILAQEIGTSSNVSFGMVPNPALEPEDTIRITRDRAGIDEDHIIDSLTIGLAATEQMSGATRERLVQM